jgi:hypothetical protein
MDGAPIAWAELWRVLKAHGRARGQALAEESEDAGASLRRETLQPVQKELPLHNSVTGSNFPRADR